MEITVNKSTNEMSSFVFLISRRSFTSEILSFASRMTDIAQNLAFVGQKFADKSQYH